jgi:hypothetical protein
MAHVPQSGVAVWSRRRRPAKTARATKMGLEGATARVETVMAGIPEMGGLTGFFQSNRRPIVDGYDCEGAAFTGRVSPGTG